jgi:hypothetical protein
MAGILCKLCILCGGKASAFGLAVTRPSLEDLSSWMAEHVRSAPAAEVDGWHCPGCDRGVTVAEGGLTHADDCRVDLELARVCAEDARWGEAHPWATWRFRATTEIELQATPVAADDYCREPSHYRTLVLYVDTPGVRLRQLVHRNITR